VGGGGGALVAWAVGRLMLMITLCYVFLSYPVIVFFYVLGGKVGRTVG